MISKDELLQDGYRITAHKTVREPGLFLMGRFVIGDADGEKEEWYAVESLKELEAIQKFLSYLDSLGWNPEIAYRTSTKWMDNFYEIVGQEWEEELLMECVQDWWPRDPMGDCPARLDATCLIYSDGEHEWRVQK